MIYLVKCFGDEYRFLLPIASRIDDFSIRDAIGVIVGAGGFEPPTSRSRTVHSTGLSHAPRVLDYTLARVSRKGKKKASLSNLQMLISCAVPP